MAPLESSKPTSAPRPRASERVSSQSPLDEFDSGAGVPPVLSAAPSFGALLSALGRRWLLALLVVVLGGAATAALLMWLVPARYIGEVKVAIRKPPDYMPGSNDSTFDDYVRSQTQTIRSSRVVGKTLEKPEIQSLNMVLSQKDDTSWLVKDLIIKPAAGENLLPIKLSGDDPEEIQKFLKALIASYLEVLRDERKRQLDRLREIVKLDEDDLKELAKKLPMFDTPQVEQVRSNLIRAMVDLRRLDSEIKSSKAATATVDKRLLQEGLDEAMLKNAEAQQLLADMAGLRKRMDEIIRFSAKGDADPMLDEPRRQYQRLQDEVKQLRDGITKRVEQRLLEKASQDNFTLQRTLDERKVRLQDEIDILKGELDRMLGGQDPELRSLGAKKLIVENIRNRSVDMITRIERHGQEIPWIEVVSGPTVPSTKDRTNQVKVVGAGTVAVMGILIFTVAFVEFRARRAGTSDDITQGLGIPTVGSLPILPQSTRKAALSATTARDPQWEGRLTESVDALRTFLLKSLGEGPHVVLVTSAMQGEGKTSLASQLAASMARAWRKTLLIDGDLRKPAAHQLFDLPGEPGFSEVLRSEIEASDAIRPTAISRLWLMPAGQWDPHAQQALAQDGVGNLFEQLKEEYDLIIVDSCPVMPVTDTLLLGQHVDTVLLSVMRNTSRLPTVYAARQRLAALDISVLGAVFVGGTSALGGLDIQYPHPTTN